MLQKGDIGMASESMTIPSLYGLRALSILLVIASHCFLRTHETGLTSRILLALVGNGSVGVSIFFVLSGFLITLLLLRERDSRGKVRLADFYLRRIFRILPAFSFYIFIVAVLTAAGVLAIPSEQFWHAVTFTMDYVGQRDWFLGHVWSLSVEEQFYLIWPLLVILCSKRVLTYITSSVIVLGPVIRMADRVLFPGTRSQIEYMGHTRADMLMFGCLIALYFEHDRVARWLAQANAFRATALSAVFLFMLSPLLELRFGGVYIKTVGYTLQGITISCILLYLVAHPRGVCGSLLNSRLAAHIGAISYSLYLWQELFIGFRSFTFFETALRIGAAFLVAEFSYFFVEMPMLRMKRSLTRSPQAASVANQGMPGLVASE